MSVKLAVFDMAGTTVVDDNFVAKAFQNAFAMNGFEISIENVNPLMGYHKPLAIQMLLEKSGEDFNNELVKDIHDDFVNEMTEFYQFSPEVKPMRGAENIFMQLKERGIHIALNTGFSKDIADAIVNRFGWKVRGLVDDYIASDEVEEGRPSSLMIRELMARAGINDPLQVAKIGDTAVDIEEGKTLVALM